MIQQSTTSPPETNKNLKVSAKKKRLSNKKEEEEEESNENYGTKRYYTPNENSLDILSRRVEMKEDKSSELEH